MPNQNHPFSLLFAGEEKEVELIDHSKVRVLVRELPLKFLGDFLGVAETQHQVIEMCTYLEGESRGDGAFPRIPPPVGYAPVPAGWDQNLTEASFYELYDIACRLNFSKAATWAQRQIAAKKKVAPLYEAMMNQVQPIVTSLILPLMKQLAGSSRS